VQLARRALEAAFAHHGRQGFESGVVEHLVFLHLIE
jgi:hypothetical protein